MSFSLNRLHIFFFLSALWAIAFLPNLGLLEVDYDETRRIYPTLAMMESGDYVTPVFEGEVYNRKPPLWNWLLALSFSAFGQVNEWTARIPSALTVLFFLAYLAFARSGWMDKKDRLLAGAMLLTTFALYPEATYCGIDALFAMCSGLASLAWIDGWSLQKKGLRLWLFPSFALGLALLAKGPLALLVFYLPILSILLVSKQGRTLLSYSHLVGLTLALGMFGLWVGLRMAAEPGKEPSQIVSSLPTGPQPQAPSIGNSSPPRGMFATWWKEVAQRIFPQEEGRKFSFRRWLGKSFFVLGALMPWLLLLPFAWRQGMGEVDSWVQNILRGLRRSLLILILLIVAMPGTRARYILPVVPLMVAFLARCVSEGTGNVLIPGWKRILLVASILFSVTTVLSTLWGFGVFDLQSWRLNVTPSLISWQNHLGSILLTLLVLAKAIHVWRLQKRLVSVYTWSIVTALLVVAGLGWTNMTIKPMQAQNEMSKNFAKRILDAVPTQSPLFFLGGRLGEPFFFYFKRPWVHVDAEVTHQGVVYRMRSSVTEGRIKPLSFEECRKQIHAFQPGFVLWESCLSEKAMLDLLPVHVVVEIEQIPYKPKHFYRLLRLP